MLMRSKNKTEGLSLDADRYTVRGRDLAGSVL